MPRLTKRQLYTYALVSQGVHGSRDLLSGLLPFLQPLIADHHDQIFNPKQFAEGIGETYGWPVSTDVIEELIPRLEAAGWLQQVSRDQAKVAYVCKADFASEPVTDPVANKILGQIEDSFCDFVKQFSSLITFNYTSEELLEIFLNWLVSVEGFDRLSLLATTKQLASRAFPLTPEPSKSIFANVAVVDSEGAFLSARYIQYIARADPDLLLRIVEIASLALLTEVILDFRHPPNAARQEPGLTIFLDGPFVMDLLGLSGNDREKNAKQIIDGIKGMSCQIKVFSHSCDEIRDNLQAVLAESRGRRFGPTAEAIRRSETTEEYARAVSVNVEHFVQQELSFDVVNWDMRMFPNEHVHFSKQTYEDFLGSLHFHERILARERDAQSVAIVMRRRGGKQSRDIFSTRYFLITRNHLLAQYAREFCVQRRLLREHQEGPVMTQRRLAALLWLTLGASERQELTRRQLLVSCERVTQIRPELIDGTMKKLKKVREADLPKLEALLTQPRSAQLLLDLTMNRLDVVTEENIEEILDMMRKATAEEERLAAKEEIKEAKRKAQRTVDNERERASRLAESLAEKERELEAAKKSLEFNERNDVDMLRRWAQEEAGLERRAMAVERVGLVALALILAVAGWLIDTNAMPESARVLAWVAALLTFGFAVGTVIPGFPNVLRPWIARMRDKRFRRRIEDAGRVELMERYYVDWESVSVQRREGS